MRNKIYIEITFLYVITNHLTCDHVIKKPKYRGVKASNMGCSAIGQNICLNFKIIPCDKQGAISCISEGLI
jgi:hypothetical protein